MKVIKPQKLALLSRTFEFGKDIFFSVAVILFFPLEEPRRLLSEVDLWKFLPGELGTEAAIDACMPKTRGEFLVTGSAFPLGGKPAIACAPRARVGRLEKSLRVVGNRFWRSDGPSAPEPFTVMSLGWQNAFGGPEYKLNPLGKGAAKVKAEKGEVQPLPNIEDPRQLVKTARDKPPPAGFGPYEFTWPQRFSKVGTYDAKWMKERFPGFAADIDWTLFNTAPDDQQMDGPFVGDETFALDFMHPAKPHIEGRLPGAAVRCFVNVKTASGEEFREVPTKLDTVWFFPHAERSVLVFHGSVKVAEDDASDVLQIVAACEEAGRSRPPDHYRRVLADRLDPDKKVRVSLRESDLVPDWPGAAAHPDIGEMRAMVSEDLVRKNMRKKAARELERSRASLKAMGVDPNQMGLPEHLPEETNPSVEEAFEMQEKALAEAEVAKLDLEQRQAAHIQDLRQRFEAQGIDPEPLIEQFLKPAGGPPSFSAQSELQQLHDGAALIAARGGDASKILGFVADPEMQRRLVEAEQRMRDTYRMTAHEWPAAKPLDGGSSARLHSEILAAVRAGESFDGRDLTGADLSGIQLPGAKLAGAFMEGVKLSGANLAGADLTGVVLARADLSGTNLRGAQLARANLGAARLEKTILAEADLRAPVLSKANLAQADLRGCRLEKAQFLETSFAGSDLSGVRAAEAFFHKADLSRIRFAGADLTKAAFIEAVVEGADFSEACLRSAVFVGVKGGEASFRRAKGPNVRFVQECSFEKADFGEADLQGANLRGTRFAGASFSRARLDAADLSECDLRGAKLDRIVAREARFTKANLGEAVLLGADLMGSVLQKATIQGADFRSANLYQADMARVLTDQRVKLTQANLKKVRVDPKRVR